MDPQFKTSFIPKKPIVASPTGLRSSSTVNLFSLIAITIFIVTLALSAGVFFYKGLLVKQIEADKAYLERAREAFDPEIIERMVRLDTRIETSKKLLLSHLAVTPFFDFLSSVTLQTVRFRDFGFVYLASDKIHVDMKGEAESYASVALQSDLLNTQKYLKDTIISDMALDTSGRVTFKVKTTVDPSLITYSAVLARNPGATRSGPVSPPVTATTSSATATSTAPKATTTNP